MPHSPEEAEHQALLVADVERECRETDPVFNAITYRRFVSKSKGRRNGRQRLRRNWREVHLVKYGAGFQGWHRFPFDVCATEILGPHADAEMLKERIEELWGY